VKNDPLKTFNEASLTWDENPGRIHMAELLSEILLREVPWNPNMNVLDYGCGTGLVSLKILPYVLSVTGLEPSEGMAEQFQKKIDAMNLENCSVLNFDPQTDPSSDLPHGFFDVIFSTMTFHHVPDIKKTLIDLKPLLKEGGMIAILDLEQEDGSFHDRVDAGVMHNGFSFEEMESYLTRSGYRNIHIRNALTHKKQSTGREYGIFLATAGN
jgi:ubiquinone/menaquinone biosynthesis C-methylase UbiE